MPFLAEREPLWRVIEQRCSATSLFAYRVDLDPAPGDIARRISRMIEASLFVVADLAGGNLNVAFEMGYARALGKPLVILTDDVHALPFDVRNLRAIEYVPDEPGLEQLGGRLEFAFRYLQEQLDSRPPRRP